VAGVHESASSPLKFEWSKDVTEFRSQLKAFLDDFLPGGWNGAGQLSHEELNEFRLAWRWRLYESSLLAAAWPKRYGGAGLDAHAQIVMAEEFAKRGLPGTGVFDTFGIQMLGNTLLKWGTEEQCLRFLPRLLRREDLWCQGFSEPGAGSDLASVRTRARLTGGEWLVNGQKVWTSGGHLADWIFMLARTGSEDARNRGLTFLLVPMKQPGVEVRPIRSMDGASEFNEVYFDDARTAEENVVGQIDEGWRIAKTLLEFERGDTVASYPVEFRIEFDRLVALTKQSGRSRDLVLRQEMAAAYTRVEIMRFLGQQILNRFLTGEPASQDASLFKLYWSEHHRTTTDLATRILGADALAPTGRPPSSVYRADDPGVANSSASWVEVFLRARAETIYAGTSEIQRDILAEQALGLPREPRPASA
jgi:alkylation response protein AidB-like acyl-CoA dehydrogenase